MFLSAVPLLRLSCSLFFKKEREREREREREFIGREVISF